MASPIAEHPGDFFDVITKSQALSTCFWRDKSTSIILQSFLATQPSQSPTYSYYNYHDSASHLFSAPETLLIHTMDVYYCFNYLSSGWMVLEALPLITTPTIIISMLSSEVREPTQLESYLSRSLGLALIAFATLNLLLTGSIPLVSSFAATATVKGTSTDLEDPTAPYAVPSLSVTLTYHIAVGFYCYQQWALGQSATYAIGMIAHGFLAAMGVWVMMFASANGHIYRKAGADDKSSSFPMTNLDGKKEKLGKKL